MDDGLKVGRLETIDHTLLGCRVVQERSHATVKYVGPIEGSKTVWVGVEWDDHHRGRHNGTHNGIKYFETSSSTSGSFLKPEKLSLGHRFEDYIISRFGTSGDKSGLKYKNEIPIDQNPTNKPISSADLLSSTVNVYTDVLQKLGTISLSGAPIHRASHKSADTNETSRLWSIPSNCLDQLLPKLTELELVGCLFSSWLEIAGITSQLTTLKSLNVSHNRLRLHPRSCQSTATYNYSDHCNLLLPPLCDPSEAECLCSNAFLCITTLNAVKCNLSSWSDVDQLLCWMPCLDTLALAYNELGDFPSTNMSPTSLRVLRQLTQLDLTGTNLAHLDAFFGLVGCPTSHLVVLHLSENPIQRLLTVVDSNTYWFPQLTELGLKRTELAQWCDCFNHLLHLPKLTDLLFDLCPLVAALSSETARQEVIARLPALKSLNRVPVGRDERYGAEIDYLKRYAPEWRRIDSTTSVNQEKEFISQHPIFKLLCAKHGLPSEAESKLVTHTIKDNSIALTFELVTDHDAGDPKRQQKRLPAQMTISHVLTLARRLFRLPPSTSFQLLARSEDDLDRLHPLDTLTRELQFYNLKDGDTIVVSTTMCEKN